jgi:hypothetical protein
MSTSAADGRQIRSIFLSSAAADTDVAQRIASELKRAGYRVVTLGKIRAGDDWIPHLNNAVDQADAVLLLVSDHWLASASSQIEAAAALSDSPGRSKRVVPILIDRNAPLPPWMQTLQYVDMSDATSTSTGLQTLLSSLGDVETADQDRISVLRQRRRAIEGAEALMGYQSLEFRLAQLAREASVLSTQRRVIALLLLILLAVGLTLGIFLNRGSIGDVTFAVIAPLTGLVGAALGFYFGRSTESRR